MKKQLKWFWVFALVGGLALAGCSDDNKVPTTFNAGSGSGSTGGGSTGGAQLDLANGPAQAPNGSAAAGATDVAVLQLSLTADPNEDVVVDELTVTAFGSGDDAGEVAGVRLVLDANDDGQVQSQETVLGSGTYPADDAPLTFTALAQAIGAGSTVNWLVVYDFAAAAQAQNTFSARVATAQDVSAAGAVTPSVQVNGTPVDGAVITIAGGQASQTTTIQPGPTDGKDAWFKSYGLYQNDNYGTKGYISVGDRDSQPGERRSVIQFDLSSLPAGGTVTKAELHLYYYGTAFHNEEITLQASPIVETRNKNGKGASQTPWVEGNNGYDTNLDGICWDGNLSSGSYPYNDSRMPQYTRPDVDQTTDYGNGPNGILDEVKVGKQTGQWIVVDVTGAVQEWVSGKRANYGLMLRHKNEGSPYLDGSKNFYSSDYLKDASLRPKLVVTTQ